MVVGLVGNLVKLYYYCKIVIVYSYLLVSFDKSYIFWIIFYG